MPNDVLKIAAAAVPENIRGSGRLVSRPQVAVALAAGGPRNPADLRADPEAMGDEIARSLGVQPASPGDSQEVEFVEPTPSGMRSTVVVVEGGKVKRVLKLAK